MGGQDVGGRARPGDDQRVERLRAVALAQAARRSRRSRATLSVGSLEVARAAARRASRDGSRRSRPRPQRGEAPVGDPRAAVARRLRSRTSRSAASLERGDAPSPPRIVAASCCQMNDSLRRYGSSRLSPAVSSRRPASPARPRRSRPRARPEMAASLLDTPMISASSRTSRAVAQEGESARAARAQPRPSSPGPRSGCRPGRRRSSCRSGAARARRAGARGSRRGGAGRRRGGSTRRTRARGGSRRRRAGRSERTSSVCQRFGDLLRERASTCWRSAGVSVGSSRRSSRSASRWCAWRTVRRVASVGCAVSTSSSEMAGRGAASSSASTPRLARAARTPPGSDSRGALLVRVLAPPAEAVVLLGEVRELEVERERAQDVRLALERQRGDRLRQLLAGRVVAAPGRARDSCGSAPRRRAAPSPPAPR